MDLLIFDLDGTLIDSKRDLVEAVNATRRHMALDELHDETIASYVGNGAPVLIRRVMGEAAPQSDVDRALDYFLGYYRDHALDYTVLYPGVRESLDRFAAAGIRLAVLTNKPERISKRIVEGLGVGAHFVEVYGGNTFEQKKPDPIGIHALLGATGVDPKRTAMIGDSAVDIQTARNAGVVALGVRYGFQPGALEASGPDQLFDSMPALADWIFRITA